MDNKQTRYFSPTLYYFVTFSIAALKLNASTNGWDLEICAITKKDLVARVDFEEQIVSH